MATYVFENVDNELFAQFKNFADNLGVGFQVFDKPEKITPIQAFDQPKNPTNLTEALLALPRLDMPNGEDLFARGDNSPMRELDWMQ